METLERIDAGPGLTEAATGMAISTYGGATVPANGSGSWSANLGDLDYNGYAGISVYSSNATYNLKVTAVWRQRTSDTQSVCFTVQNQSNQDTPITVQLLTIA